MSLANLTVASEGPLKETFQFLPLPLSCPVTPTARKQARGSSYTRPHVNKSPFCHGLVRTPLFLCFLQPALSVTHLIRYSALEHVFIGTGEGPRKVLWFCFGPQSLVIHFDMYLYS